MEDPRWMILDGGYSMEDPRWRILDRGSVLTLSRARAKFMRKPQSDVILRKRHSTFSITRFVVCKHVGSSHANTSFVLLLLHLFTHAVDVHIAFDVFANDIVVIVCCDVVVCGVGRV